LWDAVLSELGPKLAAQDAATRAAMREAGGLMFYVMELVCDRLRNGAMPKPPKTDNAVGALMLDRPQPRPPAAATARRRARRSRDTP
jgi:hypothetical protein